MSPELGAVVVAGELIIFIVVVAALAVAAPALVPFVSCLGAYRWIILAGRRDPTDSHTRAGGGGAKRGAPSSRTAQRLLSGGKRRVVGSLSCWTQRGGRRSALVRLCCFCVFVVAPPLAAREPQARGSSSLSRLSRARTLAAPPGSERFAQGSGSSLGAVGRISSASSRASVEEGGLLLPLSMSSSPSRKLPSPASLQESAVPNSVHPSTTKNKRRDASSPTRRLVEVGPNPFACWNCAQNRGAMDAPPPSVGRAEPEHPMPEHNNQLLRSVISALSFESVFRRFQLAPPGGDGDSDRNQKTAAAPDASKNDLSGSSGDDMGQVDADGLRELVPPSSSRRWSRPPPSAASTLGSSGGGSGNSHGGAGQPPPSRRASSIVHAHAHNLLHGTLDPDGGVEVVFYDCHEHGDGGPGSNEFRAVDFRRDSVVMGSIRLARGGGGDAGPLDESMRDGSESSSRHYPSPPSSPIRSSEPHPPRGEASESPSAGSSPSSVQRRLSSFLPSVLGGSLTMSPGRGSPLESAPPPSACGSYPPPPPPPDELPLRFLRAGKGDIDEGLRRYQATLEWRRENGMDAILREPSPHFDLIKRHYPHYFAGRGRLGEPVFYELPPKTNLKALREGGVTLDLLLRHYMMVTEFQWQYVERDDLQRSIYIIDLDGIRFGDFVGEVVDFVKRASSLSAQHYPERAGYVFVINVPAWFKIIFSVIKPLIDESTLEKIYILRGANEIRQNMLERIPIESIPAEYGGQGPPLGHSDQEKEFRALVEHNNALARGEVPKTCPGDGVTRSGRHRLCHFCTWQQPRSY